MTISNEIITILDESGKRMGITLDWSNENIVPYLKELCDRFIDWQITTSIVWLIGAILLLVGCVICVIVNVKSFMRDNVIFEDLNAACIAGSLVIGVGCLLIIGTQIFDICRCVYMPELEIYNYISTNF